MTCLRVTLALALWTPVCVGQNAQLSGLVRDPAGLSVSGAGVNILNEQTGGRRNTRSNASGSYSLPSLSPGRGIQTLIELTPSVAATPVVDASVGQFAVNGQRNDTNYFTRRRIPI